MAKLPMAGGTACLQANGVHTANLFSLTNLSANPPLDSKRRTSEDSPKWAMVNHAGTAGRAVDPRSVSIIPRNAQSGYRRAIKCASTEPYS